MFRDLRDSALKRLITGEIDQAQYERLLHELSLRESEAAQPVVSAAPLVNPDDGLASLVTTPRAIIPLEPPRLAVGMVIGKYRLEAGQRGGMAEVWKAVDTKSSGQRYVALKFLSPLLSGNEEEMARIRATFELVEKLDHPHICRVFDLDESNQFGWYQVMRWINGRTFSKYRRDTVGLDKGLPVSEVCRLLEPVAGALDYAHQRGVLHRDIKPGNLMVDEAGHVSVIDFGLAAEVRSSLSRVSQKSVELAGTEPYFAPELWRGQPATKFSDQYAMGVTVFELLTGHIPFQSDSSLILMQATLNEAIPKVDELPSVVQDVLAKCLAKVKESRFESCSAFITALQSAAGIATPRVNVTQPNSVSDSPVRPSAPTQTIQTQPGKIAGGVQAGDRITLRLGEMEIAFRWCPPGTFLMGSPKSEPERDDDEDQVEVELTTGYWMAETTVTQMMYQLVMKSDPWNPNRNFLNWIAGDKRVDHVKVGGQFPATYINWSGAVSFCDVLTTRWRNSGVLPSHWRVILPTEAEWEYACRAGTTTAYSFGNDPSQLNQYAWTGLYNSQEAHSHEVGKKLPNPWGLLDMHGNIQEWCKDNYQFGTKLMGGRDPQGPTTASEHRRCYRGGSWALGTKHSRSANRCHFFSNDRSHDLGFRIGMKDEG